MPDPNETSVDKLADAALSLDPADQQRSEVLSVQAFDLLKATYLNNDDRDWSQAP